MSECQMVADFLNKFSQLTPWVQALLGSQLIMAGMVIILGLGFFIKEIIATILLALPSRIQYLTRKKH